MKKLYRYFLRVKLTLKYIEVLGVYIVSEILLGGDIYLNTYNNLDWGGDKDNYCFIIGYFFEIVGGAIFWVF